MGRRKPKQSLWGIITGLLDDAPQPRTKRTTKRSKPRAEGTHTFTVQKAYCTPAKSVIMAALPPYGVPVLAIEEKVSMKSLAHFARVRALEAKSQEAMSSEKTPFAMEATVTVPKAQARWAEQHIENTGILVVTGGSLDPKAKERGAGRNGRMYRAWNVDEGIAYARSKQPKNGELWIEPGCTEALQLQASIRQSDQKLRRRR